MSKAQDRLAQQMLDAYRAAIAAAGQKSPEESALSGQTMDVLNWAKSGDYRQPPKGIFYNFADPAERKRQRDLIGGAGARGTAALGTPNSTALALDKQNADDIFSEDTAKNYQENVSNAIGGATGVAGNLANADQQRRENILGAASSMGGQALQYSLNKQPWWKSLLNTAISGGAQVGAAFAAKP